MANNIVKAGKQGIMAPGEWASVEPMPLHFPVVGNGYYRDVILLYTREPLHRRIIFLSHHFLGCFQSRTISVEAPIHKQCDAWLYSYDN